METGATCKHTRRPAVANPADGAAIRGCPGTGHGLAASGQGCRSATL